MNAKWQPVFRRFPIDSLLPAEQSVELLPNTPLSTLENAIHPCFARERWQGLTASELDAITPALQLASLLIETPQLLDYWRAAFLSTPQDVSSQSGFGSNMAIFKRGSPLTRGELHAVQARFQVLANNIQLTRDPDPEESSDGITWYLRSPTEAQARALGLQGCQSRIEMSASLINWVIECTGKLHVYPANTKFQLELATSWLAFANTIVHELAHCVQFARWGYKESRHMQFEQQDASEQGFDWENTVWGGELALRPGERTLRPWPRVSLAEHYLLSSSSGAKTFVPLGKMPDDSCVYWQVPPRFIRSLFQQHFWDVTVPLKGSPALLVPKLLGVRRLRTGTRNPYTCACAACLEFYEHEYVVRSQGSTPPVPLEAVKDHVRKELQARRQAAGIGDEVSAALQEDHCSLTSEVSCDRGGWKSWYGRFLLCETPDAKTLGVPTGFTSLSDGSLVADEHFDTVSKWQVREDARAQGKGRTKTGKAFPEKARDGENSLARRKGPTALEILLLLVIGMVAIVFSELTS